MSSDGTRGEYIDIRAALDAWRECGADRVNPVRFHAMQALARRAAAYGGLARQRLDGRLAELVQAYESELVRAEESEPTGAALPAAPRGAPSLPAAPQPGPLAELIDYIAAPFPADSGEAAARDAAGLRAAYPEVPMLDYFRAVWSRVSADRQVRQSQEQVHKNAGPLNSNQLVHRALSLMREVSPGYLEKFLSYTDALIWMEQMTAAAAPAAKDAPRAGAAKKAARGKARKESA
ncbi:hypothetical protein D3C71_1388910 [compost metagenome]